MHDKGGCPNLGQRLPYTMHFRPGMLHGCVWVLVICGGRRPVRLAARPPSALSVGVRVRNRQADN